MTRIPAYIQAPSSRTNRRIHFQIAHADPIEYLQLLRSGNLEGIAKHLDLETSLDVSHAEAIQEARRLVADFRLALFLQSEDGPLQGRSVFGGTKDKQKKAQDGAGDGATLRAHGIFTTEKTPESVAERGKLLRTLARRTENRDVRQALFQDASRILPPRIHLRGNTTAPIQGRLTRQTDSLGYNPGAQYRDEAGRVFYGKQSLFGGEGHLREELLTSLIYRAAGALVPRQHLVEAKDGDKYLLSEWEELSPVSLEDAAEHKGLTDFFVLDAWLANWDVIGATSVHNIALNEEGQLLRTEGGAGLRYAGGGDLDHFEMGFKFGPEVVELESFRNPELSAFGPEAFKNVTPEMIRTQAAKLRERFTPERVAELINQAGYEGEQKSFLHTRLLERLDSIERQVLAE